MAPKKKSKSRKSKKENQSETLSLVNQVARNVRTALSRDLLELGLYAGQDGVMLALDAQDGQTPGAIAQSLGVKAPTITKTIGRLAAQGFVRREASPDDGRMLLVFLTDAGRDQIKSVRQTQRGVEKMVFADFKKQDVADLRKLLEKMDASVSARLNILPASSQAEIDDEEGPASGETADAANEIAQETAD